MSRRCSLAPLASSAVGWAGGGNEGGRIFEVWEE